MNTQASYPIESVENASRVLLMLRTQRVLRVAEVAAELNLARSSAHRMLTTLQAQGMLRQDPVTRGYLVGPRLVELGVAVIGATDLRAEARPVLESLARTTGETVHLMVLERAEVLFLDGVEGTGVIRAAVRAGDRGPAHAAAAGKVLLASLSRQELRSLYPGSKLKGGTAAALTLRRDLEAELERVRASGYATNQGESEVGLSAVAAPVRDSRGTVRAAISISGPASRLDPPDLGRLGRLAISAADDLGGRLG